MEQTGKVIQVLPEQRGSGRSGEWVKNSFVIEYKDGGYAVKLCLEVNGADKWEKMKKSVVVGADVLAKFGVSSREWQGRWFTSCQCWFVQSTNANANDNHNVNTDTSQEETPF